MIYVKFTVDTDYCGTKNEIFATYEDNTPEGTIESDFLEHVRGNAESYEYLVTGWDDENFDDDDEREEALEWYYEGADSNSYWDYITEEEYREGTE